MTSGSDPRYADYSLEELRIVRMYADAKRFPVRAAAVDAEIARREGRGEPWINQPAAPAFSHGEEEEPRAGRPLDIGRAWGIAEIITAIFGG
ncbi:MAG: hypothetical protein JST22_07195 [Bacteroidetes bacterium]|nr:hypothetical protein [Bacteroidota bacterium]